MIGLLVALLAAVPPPPTPTPAPTPAPANFTNRKWEEGELGLPELQGPDYSPAAGFTARLGLEWRF